MIHLGSETIPPCKENVIHITLDNPIKMPSCQFNNLRDHALVKSRAKEIHTRYEVASNDRAVYYFNKNKISYLPNASSVVPDGFNVGQYTLAKRVYNSKKIKGKLGKHSLVKKINRHILMGNKKRGFGPGYINGKKLGVKAPCDA